MSVYLKIKVTSLAAEAVLIRREERKYLAAARRRNDAKARATFESLQSHRKLIVRAECRAAHLARGFLAGVDYRAIERKCHSKPDWAKVQKLVERYAVGWDKANLAMAFTEWKDLQDKPLPPAALVPKVKPPSLGRRIVAALTGTS